jgi:hypothetical protein
MVHWTMAMLAVGKGAQMSILFGSLFVGVSLGCLIIRHELIVAPGRNRVLVRISLGRRVLHERSVTFGSVIAVRVSLLGAGCGESGVAIICKREEIEMPPTRTPRQQGLLLAMTMEVRLVKVYGNGAGAEPAERIARLYRNEDVGS